MSIKDVHKYGSPDFYSRVLMWRAQANPKYKKSNDAIEKAMFWAEVCIITMRKEAHRKEIRND